MLAAQRSVVPADIHKGKRENGRVPSQVIQKEKILGNWTSEALGRGIRVTWD